MRIRYGHVVMLELSRMSALTEVNFSNSRCQLIFSDAGQMTRQG